MAGVPFKVCLPCNNMKVGVVAQSLQHLQSLLKEKFGFTHSVITLEDGTIICNEDYFNLLEPQTSLVVQQANTTGLKANSCQPSHVHHYYPNLPSDPHPPPNVHCVSSEDWSIWVPRYNPTSTLYPSLPCNPANCIERTNNMEYQRQLMRQHQLEMMWSQQPPRLRPLDRSSHCNNTAQHSIQYVVNHHAHSHAGIAQSQSQFHLNQAPAGRRASTSNPGHHAGVNKPALPGHHAGMNDRALPGHAGTNNPALSGYHADTNNPALPRHHAGTNDRALPGHAGTNNPVLSGYAGTNNPVPPGHKASMNGFRPVPPLSECGTMAQQNIAGRQSTVFSPPLQPRPADSMVTRSPIVLSTPKTVDSPSYMKTATQSVCTNPASITSTTSEEFIDAIIPPLIHTGNVVDHPVTSSLEEKLAEPVAAVSGMTSVSHGPIIASTFSPTEKLAEPLAAVSGMTSVSRHPITFSMTEKLADTLSVANSVAAPPKNLPVTAVVISSAASTVSLSQAPTLTPLTNGTPIQAVSSTATSISGQSAQPRISQNPSVQSSTSIGSFPTVMFPASGTASLTHHSILPTSRPSQVSSVPPALPFAGQSAITSQSSMSIPISESAPATSNVDQSCENVSSSSPTLVPNPIPAVYPPLQAGGQVSSALSGTTVATDVTTPVADAGHSPAIAAAGVVMPTMLQPLLQQSTGDENIAAITHSDYSSSPATCSQIQALLALIEEPVPSCRANSVLDQGAALHRAVLFPNPTTGQNGGANTTVATSSQVQPSSRETTPVRSVPRGRPSVLASCFYKHQMIQVTPGAAATSQSNVSMRSEKESTLCLLRLEENLGRVEDYSDDDEDRLCIDEGSPESSDCESVISVGSPVAMGTCPASEEALSPGHTGNLSVRADTGGHSTPEDPLKVADPKSSKCLESPAIDEGYRSATPLSSDTAKELSKCKPFSSFLQAYSSSNKSLGFYGRKMDQYPGIYDCASPDYLRFTTDKLSAPPSSQKKLSSDESFVVEEILLESKDCLASSSEEDISIDTAVQKLASRSGPPTPTASEANSRELVKQIQEFLISFPREESQEEKSWKEKQKSLTKPPNNRNSPQTKELLPSKGFVKKLLTSPPNKQTQKETKSLTSPPSKQTQKKNESLSCPPSKETVKENQESLTSPPSVAASEADSEEHQGFLASALPTNERRPSDDIDISFQEEMDIDLEVFNNEIEIATEEVQMQKKDEPEKEDCSSANSSPTKEEKFVVSIPRDCISLKQFEPCRPLLVSLDVDCTNGKIMVYKSRKIKVSADFMDLDSEHDSEAEVVDLTLEEEDETPKGEDKTPKKEDKTPKKGDKPPDKEEPMPELEEEDTVQQNGTTPLPQHDECDMSVVHHEEMVQTTSPHCTDQDVDKCVGQLLASEYVRQSSSTIMDKKSILELQALSEEFSNDSVFDDVLDSPQCNEVVIGSLEGSEEQIPLDNSTSDASVEDSSEEDVNEEAIEITDKHMLSPVHQNSPGPTSSCTLHVFSSGPIHVCKPAAKRKRKRRRRSAPSILRPPALTPRLCIESPRLRLLPPRLRPYWSKLHQGGPITRSCTNLRGTSSSRSRFS